MRRFVMALDLINDPALISEYDNWHRDENGWPEVRRSILESGITDMTIYRTGNRLSMIIDTNDDFSFENKSQHDLQNPIVQNWEKLMWKFQQPLPWAKPGEKWILMQMIFHLKCDNNHSKNFYAQTGSH